MTTVSADSCVPDMPGLACRACGRRRESDPRGERGLRHSVVIDMTVLMPYPRHCPLRLQQHSITTIEDE